MKCPECDKVMDEYLDANWDGKCPICGSVAAIAVYRLIVMDSPSGPYMSDVDCVYGQFHKYLDVLEKGIIQAPLDGGRIFVSMNKERLQYMRLGFVTGTNYMLEMGFSNKRISYDGVIQNN
jgi:hypothetical protein